MSQPRKRAFHEREVGLSRVAQTPGMCAPPASDTPPKTWLSTTTNQVPGRRNFFVRGVVPRAYGDRSLLTDEDLRHYLEALPTPESRKGTYVFPRQILESGEWLGKLWARREVLAQKPALIAWGMKDLAFREKELNTWRAALPEAKVLRFERAGHYVGDEAAEPIAQAIRELVDRHP